jgi:hypothetical protein
MFVDRIELSTLDRVQKNLGGFLDTFEERIILGASSSRSLVWMMLEDLFTMSTLDLVFCCFEAVLGKAEYSVMILTL